MYQGLYRKSLYRMHVTHHPQLVHHQEIRAIRTPVDPTLMLQYEATPVPAPAEENTLETRTPGADPSVPSTLTVSEHWPAQGTNVLTPALAPVDTTLSAESSTTTPPAHACQTMSGTHSEGAVSNPSPLSLTLATPTLVVAVHWPDKLGTSVNVLVLRIYSEIRTESVSRSVSLTATARLTKHAAHITATTHVWEYVAETHNVMSEITPHSVLVCPGT